MNRFLRLAASIVIVAAALTLAYQLCYLRYRCNLLGARAERSLMAFFQHSDQVGARIAARDIEEQMRGCIECWPANPAFPMARAAALRMLGRPDEAEHLYRQTLRFDRRSELYLNLGMTEFEEGHTREAVDALTTAAFLQYTLLDDFPHPMQDRIREVVDAAFTAIHQKKGGKEIGKQLRERVTRDPM